MTTPPPAAPAPAQPLSESDDKLWASLAHLGGIVGILPSLLIWLILKDRGPKVNVEAKEALNFQIIATIVIVASYILGTILAVVLIGFLFYFIAFAVSVVVVIFSIMGFVKVNGGGSYRYPVTVRFIK